MAASTDPSDRVCVSLFSVILSERFKGGHPPLRVWDARKMSPFCERATKGTSQNRASAVFLRGAIPEQRLLRGETRTKKVVSVYDDIVRTLAGQGKRTGIKQVEVEDQLTLQLGATQRQTLRRHIGLMIRLGYLKQISEGTAHSGAAFDLVGHKLLEIRARQKAQSLLEVRKGGARRR